MTKDEMKNRISMALKDPVLQQGFEIICKENAELEKKISNLLSCKNCPENKGGLICQKEYEDKCLAQKIQYIKELKEENAELKEHHRSVCENLTNTHRNIREQLTKAKELLKWWVSHCGNHDLHYANKTEQFLKEVSE